MILIVLKIMANFELKQKHFFIIWVTLEDG